LGIGTLGRKAVISPSYLFSIFPVSHFFLDLKGNQSVKVKLTISHIDTAWLWRYTQTQQKVSTKSPTLSCLPALPGSSRIVVGLSASLITDRPKLDNPM
jgi:hypothetical protein